MTIHKGKAFAKVNLTLHVTGQRADGYHLLDSLVVFADVADHLTVSPAPDLRLTVSGPFGQGVPADDSNLVLRAAQLLQRERGIDTGAAIALDKHLPHAAGIGGGSADAATALSLLTELWQLDPPTAAEALTLGADVPACLAGPRPILMRGVGEVIAQAPRLPPFALVLVNPKVSVPTSGIFKALKSRDNAPMSPLQAGLDLDGFAAWLDDQRNDLQPPARALAPEIDATLAKLSAQPAVRQVGMSGSGATCWGLTRNMADARHVARAIQVSEMNWWVAPAEVL